jgi:hypothetical protein
MKKVDPTIMIVAPEIEFDDPDILDHLMGADPALNIKGTIPGIFNNLPTGAAAGKPYIDFLSVHSYSGYSRELTSRNQFIREGNDLQDSYDDMKDYLAGTNIKLIVDEFNVGTYPEGNASSDFDSTAVTATNKAESANSFIGAQVLAEKMCGMMDVRDAFSNPLIHATSVWSTEESDFWGLLEDNGTQDDIRKPSYWHYWMLGNYFKGKYYRRVGEHSDTTTAHQAWGLKSFSCRSADYIAVLVLNESTADKYITMDLDGTPLSTSNIDLSFDFDSVTVSGSYPDTIPAKSSYLMFFSCTGTYLGHYEYSESQHLSWISNLTTYDAVVAPPSFGTIPATLKSTLTITSNNSCAQLGNIADVSTSFGGSNSWYRLPENTLLGTGSSVSDLAPGYYKLNNNSGCDVVEQVFSIHQKAPLVHAGADKMYCTSTNPAIGDNELPFGPSYSWSPTTVGSTSSAFTAATAANTYVMTASEGGCQMKDTVVIFAPSATSDVFMRDSPLDIGSEPNTESVSELAGQFWLSPDIWIRRDNDSIDVHQNPYHNDTCTVGNYVYVRLTNRSCELIEDGTLDLYYSKAGTGLTWDTHWNNFVCIDAGGTSTCDTVLTCGDSLMRITGIDINPNSEYIVEDPWCVPDPSDFSCLDPSADLEASLVTSACLRTLMMT